MIEKVAPQQREQQYTPEATADLKRKILHRESLGNELKITLPIQ